MHSPLIYAAVAPLSYIFFTLIKTGNEENKMETHYVTLCRGPSVVKPISFLMHYVSLLSKPARKAQGARRKDAATTPPRNFHWKAFSISKGAEKASVTIPNVTLKIW